MSACPTQTFSGINESIWNCLVEKATSYGIAISGNSGESTKDGFTVRWDYDPSTGDLQLQCTDSPWWAPCSMIDDKIHELVGECM